MNEWHICLEACLELYLLTLPHSTEIVSQDPRRFNIDERELNSRRTFVEKAKKRLTDIRADMQKQKDEVEKRNRRKPKNSVQETIQRENEEFIGNEVARQEVRAKFAAWIPQPIWFSSILANIQGPRCRFW